MKLTLKQANAQIIANKLTTAAYFNNGINFLDVEASLLLNF